MKTRLLKPMAAAVALVTGAASSVSLAQVYELEEVIITATKRAESIQDVPISVSAFSGDFLEDGGLKNLEDLANIASNLYISKSSQTVNQRIAVRGVGSVGNNAIDPSVAVYVDGVYVPRPGAILGNLKDIEVVEVLRGPQGTLFGRNASMGALNLRTHAPELAETWSQVDTGLGDFGAYDATLIANIGITDTVAARMVANYSTMDGYGENAHDSSDEVGGSRNESLKTSFLYEPTPDVSAVLRLDYQEIKGEGGIIDVDADSVTAARLANITARTGGNAPDVSGMDHKINQVHKDQMSDRQWGAVLDVNWDDAFDEHSIRSITSYRDWTNLTEERTVVRLPINDASRISNYGSESFSQEIQLISPISDTFDYVAGLYYFQEDYDIDQAFELGPDFCPVYGGILQASGSFPGAVSSCLTQQQNYEAFSSFNQEAESIAAFFQGTYHLTDAADITLGVRYTNDSKEGDFVTVATHQVASFIFAAPESARKLKFDDEQVTWFANAKYFINPDIMVFATASTGYKSGGFNSQSSRTPLTSDQRTFDSEEVINYELGIKSTLLDGRLIANATMYRTDIKEYQDRSFQQVSYAVTNAGELRQQGVEMDVQYSPIEPLFISLGYAYLDSKFLSFDQASNLPGLPGTQDLKGGEGHFGAEHQLNLAAQWSNQLGDSDMNWFVRAEVSWTDDANVGATTNNNPQTVQEAYALTNIRAGIGADDERWSLTAFVENVGDKEYCTAKFDQPAGSLLGIVSDGGTLIRCVMAPPRTFGIRGSYFFD